MSKRKKRLLFHSDITLANTGFGRSARCVLTYLYNTNKYDIYHYCCGIQEGNETLLRTPWKSIGCLPNNPVEMDALQKSPDVARMASYGMNKMDDVIKEVKPDVLISVQDIWGIDFSISKPWFNKISAALWTTLDSLPILPTAIKAAERVDNFWVWSKFAEEDMHKQGLKNVRTIHGALDTKFFYRLNNKERLMLRSKYKIRADDFVIGFVFRNQLRKSVPNLLEGFSILKKTYSGNKNPKLLLHTNFSEGWNIHKLAKEYGVDPQDLLTTYVCQNCRSYEISPFSKQNLDCKYCGSKNTVSTTNVSVGVSEEQLNEVYNLMDVYCHPFTSGGQEIPIQEAKLTELITLVTNYSCGEEMCEASAQSLPLEWTEYREHGTEFRKASTCPKSIAEKLQSVLEMSESEREEVGKLARQWTVNNYSAEVVGKQIEDFLDSCELTTYDFDFENILKDPNVEIKNIEDNSKWLTELYEKILKRENVLENDEGHRYWMDELGKGMSRKNIEDYFRQVAIKENSESKNQVKLGDILSDDDENKRILFVSPRNKRDAFLVTSLFKSIKEKYPDFNIYTSCSEETRSFFVGNEYIFKIIPCSKEMEHSEWLNGVVSNTNYFNIVFSPQNINENKLAVISNVELNIDKESLKY